MTTAQVTMTPVTPPFDDVLNSYMNHVVQEFYPEPAEFEQIKNVIHSYISNLRRENTSEIKIYEQLEELNPLLGNPLTFYEELSLTRAIEKLQEHKKGQERSRYVGCKGQDSRAFK